MNITFLGTSSGVPTLTRNVSSLALKLTQKSDIWLFDCGEGTQHQLMKSKLKSSQIKKIFITHMHGDHIYGLPGLLATLGLSGNSNGIELYGPSDLKEFVNSALENSYCKLSYPLNFFKVEDYASTNEHLYEDNLIKVKCASLKHRLPAFGYRVSEKDKPGRFDIEKARRLKIPPGPIYAKLQSGQMITLDDWVQILQEGSIPYQEPGASGPTKESTSSINVSLFLFLVMYIFVMCFFIFNLLIAVLVDNFSLSIEENKGVVPGVVLLGRVTNRKYNSQGIARGNASTKYDDNDRTNRV